MDAEFHGYFVWFRLDALLLSSCGKVLETDGDALKRSLAVQFEGEAGMVFMNFKLLAYLRLII